MPAREAGGTGRARQQAQQWQPPLVACAGAASSAAQHQRHATWQTHLQSRSRTTAWRRASPCPPAAAAAAGGRGVTPPQPAVRPAATMCGARQRCTDWRGLPRTSAGGCYPIKSLSGMDVSGQWQPRAPCLSAAAAAATCATPRHSTRHKCTPRCVCVPLCRHERRQLELLGVLANVFAPQNLMPGWHAPTSRQRGVVTAATV
jgi:hypothetical protein